MLCFGSKVKAAAEAEGDRVLTDEASRRDLEAELKAPSASR